MRIAMLFVAIAGEAAAQPVAAAAEPAPALEPSAEQPPAPLTLPDLAATTRVTVSLAALKSLDAFGGTLMGRMTYALGDVELFGDAALISFFGFCIEGCHNGSEGELAFGNTRLGARYMLQLGPIVVAPAVGAWLPTSTASMQWHPPVRAVMTAADDPRRFLDDGALAGSLDVAWRGERGFVQAEYGAALVADGGPQLDDVFAGVGAGARVTPSVSMIGEYRVDAYARESLIHTLGYGMSFDTDAARTWRVHLHVASAGTFGSQELPLRGWTLGVNMEQPW